MSAESYTCKKGFLLSMDENGDYLPFFVQVRDQDIIPSTDVSFPFGVKLHNLGLYEKIKYLPTSIGKAFMEFDYDGWKVKLYSDYSYEAKIQVPVNRTMFTTRETNHFMLIHQERLPIVSDIEDFYGFLTIDSTSSEILAAVPSFTLIRSSGELTKEYPVAMEICLSNYHNDLFDNLDYYYNTHVNVKIEGKALLVKASNE